MKAEHLAVCWSAASSCVFWIMPKRNIRRNDVGEQIAHQYEEYEEGYKTVVFSGVDIPEHSAQDENLHCWDYIGFSWHVKVNDYIIKKTGTLSFGQSRPTCSSIMQKPTTARGGGLVSYLVKHKLLCIPKCSRDQCEAICQSSTVIMGEADKDVTLLLIRRSPSWDMRYH